MVVNLELILRREEPFLIVFMMAGLLTGIMFYFLPFLTALSIMAFGVLCLFTIQRLETGIYFCILFVPIELHALEFLPWFVKYFDEGLLALMTLIILYRILRGEVKFRPTPLGLPLLAFITVGFLSVLFNRVPIIIGVAGLRAMLQYVMLYYIIVHAGFGEGTYKRLINLVLIVASITVFYGFFQRLIGLETAADWEMRRYHTDISLRVFSTMLNPNTYGAYLVTMIALSLNLFIYTLKKNKNNMVLFLFLNILLLWGLQMTYSRMSMISLAAGILALFLLYQKKYLPVFLVSVILVIVMLPSSYFDRLLFVISPEYIALSLKGGRLFLIQKSWEVVTLSPLLGAGPGMFGGSVAGIFNSPLYDILEMPYHMNLDNFYFQVWAELGTLGLFAFLWLFKNMFVQAYTAYKGQIDPYWKTIAAGTLTIFTALVVQSLVAGIWEVHQVAAYIWFFAGLTYLMKNQNLCSKEQNKGGQLNENT